MGASRLFVLLNQSPSGVLEGFVIRHGADKAESSHSRGKDKEEAVPRDRPQDDDRRYLTEEEVRNIRYPRPLSVHLLNKYEQQYDRRRRYDNDDEGYRRSMQTEDYTEMPGLDRSIIEHRLPLKKGFRPFQQRARQMKAEVLEEVKKEIKKMLDAGFIGPCSLAKLRRTSTTAPTPRRRAVGFKRSYYFRCPLEREVDVVFINNRTCDRVRRCCPFVAPEPIVIKIFYALLQAASERLPQQQEPPLVGFGISSRNMNKEFPELFGMLKAAEIEIKKEHQVLMVNKTTSFKKQGKSKGKNKKSGKKAATPPVKPKSGPKPDAECYYRKEKGHWA
ncbi:hypothetical protein QYE76_028013 [Lolium multiflorum]|uniref:Uncharacterized protein n=1 Tax=Lolium multiflorum TaxID=4521 RepID=A0AAD8VGW4_LOLMU|nr:hypothetical protein QYE76_028013 [Lolium multiflorum]